MIESKKRVNPVIMLMLIMGVAIGTVIIWQQIVEPSLANQRRAAAESPWLDGDIIESQHCVNSDQGRDCVPVTCYVQKNGDLYCVRNQ